MALTKVNKKKVIDSYRKSKNDTGSEDVQVAVLTERINGLEQHFKKNIKDHHSRRGLIQMVNRRKRLLAFIKRMDEDRYKELISRLKLRK